MLSLSINSVTFHPTQVNTPRQAGTQFNYPGGMWKAELTWVTVAYQDGLAANLPAHSWESNLQPVHYKSGACPNQYTTKLPIIYRTQWLVTKFIYVAVKCLSCKI